MIVITILLFIVAMSLPSFQSSISAVSVLRISALSFIYAGALALNALYIQEIGSGIGIYSGLFQVTSFSQYIDIFIMLAASACVVGIMVSDVSNSCQTSRLHQAFPDRGQKSLSTVASVQTTLSAILARGNAEPGKGDTPSNIRQREEQRLTVADSVTPKYALIVLFSTLGSLMLVSSSDLISMYLSIELQSFGVYILATLYRDSALATSAGLKYFLLGGLSSCLILLGAGLIYSNTGLTNFEFIFSLLGVSNFCNINTSTLISQGLLIGFTLIFVGFLFKIAAAPLHNWAPDVYDDSPTIVTIWLTIMPKIAILMFLLELSSGLLLELDVAAPVALQQSLTSELGAQIAHSELPSSLQILSSVIYDNCLTLFAGRQQQGLQNLLLLSSLLSLLIGTIVGLAQTKIKRLLAYSTISHIGFMLLALSLNTEQSIESFIFYIIQYTLTNLNVFIILIAFAYLSQTTSLQEPESQKNFEGVRQLVSINPDVRPGQVGRRQTTDIKFITELKGLFFSNPLLSISFAICFFSMAGIPPLIGFFSKQMVLYTAIQNGYYFMAIVAIIVSVVSASYYLKIIKTLFVSNIHASGGVRRQPEVSILQPEGASESSDEKALPLVAEAAKEEYEATASLASPGVFLHSQTVRESSKEASGRQTTRSEQRLCSNSHSFLISTLTLTILLYILNPSILLNSTQLLSLTLFSSV